MSISEAIIITGATGFLGHHALAEMREQRIETVTMGRRPVPGARRPIRHIQLDSISSVSEMTAAIRSVRPAAVIHLAGAAPHRPREELEAVNIRYASALLSAVRASGLDPVVVLAGSAAEYGLEAFRQGEPDEDTACHPVSAYGATKHAQTLHGLSAAKEGVRVIVARMFNLIGERMPRYLAMASFAHQIAHAEGDTCVLRTGNLRVERDFITARDAARLLLALCREPRAVGQIVNLCTGHGTRLDALLAELIRISGRTVRVETDPARLRSLDPTRAVGNPRKLRAWGLAPPLPDFDAVLGETLCAVRNERAA